MSTHVQTQSSLITLTAGAASAAGIRESAARTRPMAGVAGAIARFGRRFMSALMASRAAHALAEIEAYDPRLGAELRAAIDRSEDPFA